MDCLRHKLTLNEDKIEDVEILLEFMIHSSISTGARVTKERQAAGLKRCMEFVQHVCYRSFFIPSAIFDCKEMVPFEDELLPLVEFVSIS